MPTPDFILELRRHIGHAPLWLIGVTAVVVRESSTATEVLLGRRSDSGEWAPIKGIVDPGENIDAAAIREVAEETCVQARVERLVWVKAGPPRVHQNGDQAQYLDHVLRCQWISGEARVGDDESLEVAWWPSDDLPPMSAENTDRVLCALANIPETYLG